VFKQDKFVDVMLPLVIAFINTSTNQVYLFFKQLTNQDSN